MFNIAVLLIQQLICYANAIKALLPISVLAFRELASQNKLAKFPLLKIFRLTSHDNLKFKE